MHRDTKQPQQTVPRGNSVSRRGETAKGLSVSIIGTGRLGTALGLALKAAGYRIDLVVAKRTSTAQRAGKIFGSKTVALSARQLSSPGATHQALLDQSSLVLITTPDDAIGASAQQLSQLFSGRPIRRRAGPPAS